MEKADANIMETVLLTVSRGIVLVKMLTSSLPLSLFQSMRKRRAVLVVFIPPPAEPGEAPMNMRIIIKRMVSLVSCPISTVLKPAVLGVIDWKNEIKIFVCQGTFFIIKFFSKK
jgi:hypothetical protein